MGRILGGSSGRGTVKPNSELNVRQSWAIRRASS